jgi:hypothetical protein
MTKCQNQLMPTTRTTIRIDQPLKIAAQTRALEMNISFQKLVNTALKTFLKSHTKTTAKKIVFRAQNIGRPLDNLTREDIYAD